MLLPLRHWNPTQQKSGIKSAHSSQAKTVFLFFIHVRLTTVHGYSAVGGCDPRMYKPQQMFSPPTLQFKYHLAAVFFLMQ